MTDVRLADRAAALRRDFDGSFAEPLTESHPDFEALLGVRVAGARYVLSLADLAGLFVDRRIVPLPTSAPGLLGISGIRGTVAPVYSLPVLLGHPPLSASPRWIVLARAELVGFAFDGFDGQFRVPRTAILSASDDAAGANVRHVVRLADAVFPIVHVQALLDTIKSKLSVTGTIKE